MVTTSVFHFRGNIGLYGMGIQCLQTFLDILGNGKMVWKYSLQEFCEWVCEGFMMVLQLLWQVNSLVGMSWEEESADCWLHYVCMLKKHCKSVQDRFRVKRWKSRPWWLMVKKVKLFFAVIIDGFTIGLKVAGRIHWKGIFFGKNVFTICKPRLWKLIRIWKVVCSGCAVES